jgi:hypothetical protein
MFNGGGTIAERPQSTRLQGTLRESSIRHARLAAADDISQAAQNAGAPNKPSLGSGALKGALWGAGVGAAVGFAAGLPGCGPANECAPGVYALGGAMVGAAYGSIIGLVVNALRR